MIKHLPCVFLLLVTSLAKGQVIQTDSLKAPLGLDNIANNRLAGDSLVSSFVIYIKKEVKAHKHLEHSEHVLILEGEGTMKLGNETLILKPGLWIFIPKGTVHSVKTTSLKPLKVLSVQAPAFDGKDRIWVE